MLFGDALSAAITIGAVALIALMLPPLNWALLDAVWSSPDAPNACRAGGACWAYLHDKARLILFGIYPPDQQWRPVLVIALIVAMVLASLSPRLWNARLLLLWATAIGVMLLLMQGGGAGAGAGRDRQMGRPAGHAAAGGPVAWAGLSDGCPAGARTSVRPADR
ncbi:hypothetical protein [Paracoccus marcusii]|uniref:hypothetical protein n=1 Tax=Paracoccus marcusii TaxID=59779 RepID=UPI001FCC88E9|nr:hypothetical protein [Paracoccus marcusii]